MYYVDLHINSMIFYMFFKCIMGYNLIVYNKNVPFEHVQGLCAVPLGIEMR